MAPFCNRRGSRIQKLWLSFLLSYAVSATFHKQRAEILALLDHTATERYQWIFGLSVVLQQLQI